VAAITCTKKVSCDNPKQCIIQSECFCSACVRLPVTDIVARHLRESSQVKCTTVGQPDMGQPWTPMCGPWGIRFVTCRNTLRHGERALALLCSRPMYICTACITLCTNSSFNGNAHSCSLLQ
jgi:hypothetical protein